MSRIIIHRNRRDRHQGTAQRGVMSGYLLVIDGVTVQVLFASRVSLCESLEDVEGEAHEQAA